MKKPSSRVQKILVAATTPVAVIAAAALVYQASYAAFTGQARFRVSNMLPGDTETKCLKVTANASVASTVKGFAINPVTSVQGLENRIKISIYAGNGGTFADCEGFTQLDPAAGGVIAVDAPLTQIAQLDSFEEALGGWDVPSGTHSRTYKLVWRFDTQGMSQQQIDQLQGSRTGLDMQWEMRTS